MGALTDAVGLGKKFMAWRKKRQAGKAGPGGGVGGGGMDTDDIDSYRRGGKVKRTGPAFLHKGERVLTRSQARRKKR